MNYIRPVLGLLQGIIIYALIKANLSPETTLCAAIILTFPLFSLQIKLPERRSLPLGLTILMVMAILYGIAGYHLIHGFAELTTYVPLIIAAQCILSAFIVFIFYCVAVDENRLVFAYPALFNEFWQALLKLFLGHILVYLTWGLCWLAATLFGVLGISAIYDVVSSHWFFYIMPPFFFGIAMTILYNYESILTKLRDILLAFSKFLYPILVVISLGFFVAIPFANKSISEFWVILIGLNILHIILFNGVFQSGMDSPPYAPWFRGLIYAVMALLCIYSFYILKFPYQDIQASGLKPELFYLVLFLVILCLYNLGYSLAVVLSKTPWLSLIKPINTYIALFVAALYLVLALPGFNIPQ
jgi:hypothetical protein